MRGSRFLKSPAKARRLLYLLAGAGVSVAAVQAGAGHHPFAGDSPLDTSKEKLRFGWGSVVRSSRALYTMTTVVVDYKYSLRGLEHDSEEYWKTLSLVHLRSAKRMLKLCEANKGFYVKAGQFVSSLRQVPKEFSSILSSLQDQAVPHHFKGIKEVIVTNLGKDIHEIFLTFDEQPIASASIAQVHHALLKSGQEVAVKVQYPGLELRMKIDLTTMAVLLKSVSWIFPEYKFDGVVSEFERVLSEELDFIHEAKNAERTARNFRNNTTVRVPYIFWDLTTAQVLTMEFCIGHKVDDLEFLKRTGINPLKVAKTLMETFSEMIFIHGFLHGDPHPGNILVSSSGSNGFSLVVLDHGHYKELDESFRLDYCQLWKALILRDSNRIQYLCEKFGVGKYARYFPIIFTGRTIDSKSAPWRDLSVEEKKKLKQELRYLNVGDISAFMEYLPPDFYSILRTDGILRSITGKLGAPRRIRLLAYAKYAVYGLAKQSGTDSDSAFKSASRIRTRVSHLPLITLIEILELISQFEELRQSVVNMLKRMLSRVYQLLPILY